MDLKSLFSLLKKKRTSRYAKQATRKQRGQILILVVFGIIGLIAFVGLVVDTGLMFIGYGTLRRSVDSAALAAASQYRRPYPESAPPNLKKAAVEFLTLNNVSDPSAKVYVCTDDPTWVDFSDPTLCTTPYRRRLVKVDASTTVHLAFLPVVGIKTVTLNATATSEAASLDIVLVVDASESMTFGDNTVPSPQFSFMRDPSRCNRENASGAAIAAGSPSECSPFKQIQTAAATFVTQLFPADGSNQYDRVAVVPFDSTVHDSAAGYTYNLPFHLAQAVGQTPSAYRQDILDHINALRVFQGPTDPTRTGWGPLTAGSCLNGSGNTAFPGNQPCRNYENNGDPLCYQADGVTPIDADPATPGLQISAKVPPNTGTDCFVQVPAADTHFEYTDASGGHWDRTYLDFGCNSPTPTDKSTCGTTNIGTALRQAGGEFDPNNPGFRQESLWVVIFLTDGLANHANSVAQPDGHSLYCPDGENANGYWCQDTGVNAMFSRHCLTAADQLYAGNPFLFNFCTAPKTAPDYGGGGTVNAALYDADDYARDMADFVAIGQQALVYTIGFGDAIGHDQPGLDYGEQLLKYTADVGDDGVANGTWSNNYFFAPDSSALSDIFTKIADRIATRLSH